MYIRQIASNRASSSLLSQSWFERKVAGPESRGRYENNNNNNIERKNSVNLSHVCSSITIFCREDLYTPPNP